MKTLSKQLVVLKSIALIPPAVAAAGVLANIHPAHAQGKMMQGKMMMESSVVASGNFMQVTHATKGKATLTTSHGKRMVKLTGFETGMGPKLHVYLVPGKVMSNGDVKKAVMAKKHVDLGMLKTIKGDQSYVIPRATMLGKGASVVVWCDKFDVVFGAAELS